MYWSQFFSLQNWPVIFLCAAMIVAATIDLWKLKVPNWLTFPLILSGWAFGWLYYAGSAGGGLDGFLAALALTFFGMILLLPVYSIGGVGAGDVKMQMAFGAWVGAIFGIDSGLYLVLWGFLIGVLAGGVIALGQIAWRGDFSRNGRNVADIVRDWVTSGSIHDVAAKAAERKPRMHLLPYGVPLCIGYISYLVYAGYVVAP